MSTQVLVKPGSELMVAIEAMLRLKARKQQEGAARVDGVALDPLVKYRFDPERYIVEKLGWQPWRGTAECPGQMDVVDAYVLALRQQHEQADFEAGNVTEADLKYWQPGQVIKNRLRVEAGHTVGKCVAASEYLTLADGRRVKAGDLIEQRFSLPTLVDGQIVAAEASAEFNAIESVYEIVTETGKRIVRNAQHPLWVAEAVFEGGNRPQVIVHGWSPMAEIAPGMLVAVAERTVAPVPAPDSPAFLCDNEVKLLAYLIGDGSMTRNTVRFSQERNAQLAEFIECCDALGCVVEYLGRYDYIVYGKARQKRGHNPIIDLCRAHGLMGVGSREKRIPSAVFSLPPEQLRLFLSRLYGTDGWATSRPDGGVEIGYCSASRGLIQDIQELLLRFGVHARIYHKPRVGAWTLGIGNKLDATQFIDEIGIFGKEEAVGRVRQACAYRLESHTRALRDRPARPRWQHKDAVPGTRWEKVIAVRQIGIEPTVAIEVPGYETYLTTFWEHNTKIASGLVNHFFDCFVPSIIYTFAPSWEQIHDLLWKEIKADRREKGLPGRVLDIALIRGPDHFAKGRATDDSGGKGTERVQGQHGKYLMFVLDEAEGIADYVWNAVDSMTSGGISIVLMLANPRTRISQFHKARELSNVKNFRISCLWHPNVLQGREVVPGAVRRQYVDQMMEKHCAIVAEHNADDQTFEVPWRPGLIFKPDAEMMFRVLGVAPANLADNTMIPVGRYQAACNRAPIPEAPTVARMGVDVARYGKDLGTLYVRHNGRVWRAAQFAQLDTFEYYMAIKAEALRLATLGVTSLQVRVDGGGGFGGGVIDQLARDLEVIGAFQEFVVVEVHFNGAPYEGEAYAELATEMYAAAGDALHRLAVLNPPDELEADLCERTYGWALRQGVAVKRLESKEDFKRRVGRSPDDGDGFVLAVAPDYVFTAGSDEVVTYEERVTISQF